LSNQKFLNFAEISKHIPFRSVLDSAVAGVFKKFAWGSVEYYCRS